MQKKAVELVKADAELISCRLKIALYAVQIYYCQLGMWNSQSLSVCKELNGCEQVLVEQVID